MTYRNVRHPCHRADEYNLGLKAVEAECLLAQLREQVARGHEAKVLIARAHLRMGDELRGAQRARARHANAGSVRTPADLLKESWKRRSGGGHVWSKIALSGNMFHALGSYDSPGHNSSGLPSIAALLRAQHGQGCLRCR